MQATTKRRRFQAPITSFFSATSADSSAPIISPLTSPLLPDNVQSSLLTVGMRVRKSVSDGYKTKIEQDRMQMHSQMRSSGGYFSTPVSKINSSNGDGNEHAYGSLAPFCGLHKVGGMAIQPMPMPITSSFHAYIAPIRSAAAVEDQDLRSLPSSQESHVSVASDTSAPARPNMKRGLEDLYEHDDEDEQLWAEINGHTQPHLQSQSHSQSQASHTRKANTNTAFSHTRMPSLDAIAPLEPNPVLSRGKIRQFAIPRSRVAGVQHRLGTVKPLFGGQENMPVSFGIGTRFGDFEEASFLVSREDIDMEMDMEM